MVCVDVQTSTCPILMCYMEFAWHRNGWMLIWKKKQQIIILCTRALKENESSRITVCVDAQKSICPILNCVIWRRITKHYTCAGFSAHETSNTTPVHVRALTNHTTLHLCRFERSQTTTPYTGAGSSARGAPNITPVQD